VLNICLRDVAEQRKYIRVGDCNSNKGALYLCEEFPATKSYTMPVVTPAGIPLGGLVTLIINGDGTYAVEFMMLSSRHFASFDFQLRAYLTGPGLPNLY
jgi:hypothetical protein